MKNIIFLLILLVNAELTAQQIESLYDSPTYAQANKYYKDLYNDLDAFTGTWVYTSGNTSLTITLQKKIQMQHDDYYEDVLVGGYKYVVNGTTLVNTLPLLQNNYNKASQYTLFGYYIMGPSHPYCIDCSPTTRRVFLGFWEPNRDVWEMGPEMVFERVDSGSVQKVKVIFKTTSTAMPTSLTGPEPVYNDYSIPLGTYILNKQ